MRRFFVFFAAALVLLAASSAVHAASLSVEVTFPGWTGEDIPGPGDTVVLTFTATANAGETDAAVYGELLFSNPGLISNASVSQTQLESYDGLIIWTLGVTSCDFGGCVVFNQIGALDPGTTVSNTPLVIATLTFVLTGTGPLYASWVSDGGIYDFDFFDAPTPGDICIIGVGAGCPVIPEPATGGLVALGLLGLAAARRRSGGF